MGQKNVVIDWDLPTLQEWIQETTPGVEAAYQAKDYNDLYVLAAAIDTRLSRGVHLHDSQGRALTKFDQWLLAAERGEWPPILNDERKTDGDN